MVPGSSRYLSASEEVPWVPKVPLRRGLRLVLAVEASSTSQDANDGAGVAGWAQMRGGFGHSSIGRRGPALQVPVPVLPGVTARAARGA